VEGLRHQLEETTRALLDSRRENEALRKQLLSLLQTPGGSGISMSGSACNDTRQLQGEDEDSYRPGPNDTMAGTTDSLLGQA
jgi:hypothetical protein